MFRRTVFPLIIALAFLAASCTGPAPVQPTQDLGPAYTQAMQTIVAALTQTVPVDETLQPAPTGDGSLATDTPPPAAPTDTPQNTDTPAATNTPDATATPEPSPTVQPTPTPTRVAGTIVFEDDFSSETGWYEDSRTNWVFEFVNQQYRITNNIPGAVLWSIREVPYTNVRVEVDASRTAGPPNGFYGVTCRYVDEHNYYALVAASNGFYAILRMRDGSMQFRATGTDVSGVIRPGNEVNRIAGECIGNTLTLYVNGQKIAEETDDFFDEGWVGVVAGNRIEPGMQATFDNFAVLRP
jgi:hypothetical protein